MHKPKLYTLIFFALLSCRTFCQGGITVGFHMANIRYDVFKEWAEEASPVSLYPEPYDIPQYTLGGSFGHEFEKNNFVVGLSAVFNSKTTKATKYDVYGNINPVKLRIKYHHVEMPFFWFPGNSFIGIGTTVDAGIAKVQEISEDNNHNLAKEVEMSSKFGLRLRYRGEHVGFGTMLYYQFAYFGMTGGYNTIFDLRPTQMGVRVMIFMSGKD